MRLSFQKLKADLHDSLIAVLWDQWVSIGLAGGARHRSVPFVIDPEALLLATTQFAGDDARDTGWYSKSVQIILNDLESSGLVYAERSEREKHFRLETKQWLPLFHPVGHLQWFTQPPFYIALQPPSRNDAITHRGGRL